MTPCTTYLVLPCPPSYGPVETSQQRIVSRRARCPLGLADYRHAPDGWAEAGLVNASGRVVCTVLRCRIDSGGAGFCRLRDRSSIGKQSACAGRCGRGPSSQQEIAPLHRMSRASRIPFQRSRRPGRPFRRPPAEARRSASAT